LHRRYGSIALLLLVILLFGFVRFRLRNFPLERDEGEYAYAGQLMLQRVPPYQLAYNMKLPGTYAAYAAILALFGQTPAGVHLGLILVSAATTFFLYLLAGRLFGRLAGIVAGASYALLSTSPSVLGLAGHATHFVLLPAIAGLLLLLKALESKRLSSYFGSGVLLGLAFLMKQPGIIIVAFAGLYLLYRECRPWPLEWQPVIKRAGAFSVGAIIPFGLTCLFLAFAGVFDKFWFWTFTYAREYGSILSISDGVSIFEQVFPAVVHPSILIWVLAAVGLTALFWDRDARPHAPFVIGFLLFSSAAVCPGFYFREHYFILVLPAVAILAGVAVSSATRMLLAAGRPRIVAALPVGVFVIVFGYSIFQQRAMFFETDPLVACREIYGGNPFPEAVKISEYIRAHTSPTDRIAVLGSEPEIYFYSARRSATGYVYTYGLMEPQPYAVTMQREMIAEIEAAHPEYMVVVQVPMSWLARPGSSTLIYSWAQEYLQQNYEVTGIADIEQQQSQYIWGEAARGYSPQSPYAVYVFKRKTL
jgi:4-amino-4-deoxy-L-arabinose transferase-like glycosyltransferase